MTEQEDSPQTGKLTSERESRSRAEANFQFLIKDYDGRQIFFSGVLTCMVQLFTTRLVIIGKTTTYCIDIIDNNIDTI